jgi:hypothetical protein
MGEESLFLPGHERLAFLAAVFSKRLSVDARIPQEHASLHCLLGQLGLSKTEFARRLRVSIQKQTLEKQSTVAGSSQRRGRSRGRVQYFGEEVFSGLWSGDTRTMIQLIADVIDHAAESDKKTRKGPKISTPVEPSLQDLVFRNRGGEWLNSHTRNEPTNPLKVKEGLGRLRGEKPGYALLGQYGDHLKAVVEAFVAAATRLLLGPTYIIYEGKAPREVPRMAFRIEILDEFRVEGLAQEIYRDLIRYGLFMRDNRGKSVRGTFVPRLYLRRLLLPYCTLALSKRDSVSLTCAEFIKLLLEPDKFKRAFSPAHPSDKQLSMPFIAVEQPGESDPAYDDLSEDQAEKPESDEVNC